jgi:hypothetical protein
VSPSPVAPQFRVARIAYQLRRGIGPPGLLATMMLSERAHASFAKRQLASIKQASFGQGFRSSEHSQVTSDETGFAFARQGHCARHSASAKSRFISRARSSQKCRVRIAMALHPHSSK